MEIEALLDFLNGEQWWQIGATGIIVVSVLVATISYAVVKITTAIKAINEVIKNLSRSDTNDYTPHVYMDVNVSSLLHFIRNHVHADRVSVYQYHNGEKDIANNRFLKVSCTHESISSNVGSVQKYMESIPTAMLGNWNTYIFEKQNVYVDSIKDIEDVGELRGAYQLMANNYTSSVYLFPLTTPMGKVFGFGLIEYCKTGGTVRNPDEKEEIRKLDNWLGKEFNAVGVLLSQSTVEEDKGIYHDRNNSK